ncbi:lysozyme inhibitor LprI family protein [Caulobacter sp. NIBR1757]|uniref:lysozyme inhibitor LprI family protein n=1 Tax=Caulobacter sp. NIBR1757 TaxID=3016000 RepID=UPI0022F0C562|nr:lysozyme inhibitor LprI family protein [Caulobacter sp. NIBR1757]
MASKAAAPIMAEAPPVSPKPSFDCAKAKASVERLACESPTLAVADQRMAQSYRTQMERFPASQRSRLLEGQRSFLNYARTACADDPVCLEWAYDQRTADLDTSFAKAPAILTLTRYATSAAPDGPMLRRTGRRLLLDQLADPATPGERALNAMMAQWLAEADAASPVAPSLGGGIEGAAVEFRSISESRIVVAIQGPTVQRLIDWSPKLGRPLEVSDEKPLSAGDLIDG